MASTNIIVLTPDNFEHKVLKSDTPVLVDFWAEWCGPCKMIAPILDELADEYSGRVHIGKVNIEDHQNLATEYGVRAIPTLLLFQRSVRTRPAALYGCAVMVVFGFIANRLNVGVTALEAASGTHYVPRWSEVAVTLSIVAVGFAIFRWIAQYFPIFEAHGHANAAAPARVTEAEHVPVG